MVKAYVCKAAEWVTREAMQIHGGYGYAEEYPVSRLFVDARVLSIFEGADETLCLKVIARRLTEPAAAVTRDWRRHPTRRWIESCQSDVEVTARATSRRSARPVEPGGTARLRTPRSSVRSGATSARRPLTAASEAAGEVGADPGAVVDARRTASRCPPVTATGNRLTELDCGRRYAEHPTHA